MQLCFLDSNKSLYVLYNSASWLTKTEMNESITPYWQQIWSDLFLSGLLNHMIENSCFNAFEKKIDLARKHIPTVTFRGLLKVFLIKIDRSVDCEKMCSEGSNYDLILCQNIFCCVALFQCVGENVISGWLLKVLTCVYKIFWVRFFSINQKLLWILLSKWIH